MTKKAIDTFVRNGREADLALWADRLAVRFAERAAKHDREGSFPFENFEELKAAGYAKLTLSEDAGGDGLSLYEWLLVQERIARGDGSTALSAGWHGGMMLHYRETDIWPEPSYSAFNRDVVRRGAMINKFASEKATGSPTRGGRPQAAAVREEGGWRISGRKTYSTLSPLLTDFIVSAGIENSPEVGDFIVRLDEGGESPAVESGSPFAPGGAALPEPEEFGRRAEASERRAAELRRRAGVTVEETWDTLGMRATGSHDVVLDGVFVPDSQVMGIYTPGDRKAGIDDGDGWMLHIPACYLGIAHAARDYALKFAKNYTPNSLKEPISTLPHIRQWIGQIESELRLARTLLYDVADRWDRNPEERASMRPDLGLVKYNATHLAAQVVDKAMKIVGGASLSKDVPLERYYRDVRAGLHNPPMEDAVLQTLARRALEE
ncbi:acyl-CoA dehydrogenase family protein [Saccharibacillus sp. CPCC 101409]|uniref:acyl-CoA dehydrogenase family protein n=1 Tax=Saccharibacillus sp. CPCC 101409 TaxID=3058041 RepID=UPI0026726573|nr:acyl-CoA dehydrogenase family protein [Saccharibacillus sp. CPCC 101409]MDO3408221.1 acyl-CoA dehydrogenase family protein [Saccharibacillus sp. CPCC 101409]